jgi:hypothetical protein
MSEPKQSPAAKLSTLLTGRFLVNPKVFQHWPFILFLSFLALVMTASSHTAERRVHEIARLQTEMKELQSQFIDTRTRLMGESMESKVLSRVSENGLKLHKNTNPPRLISVKKETK